MKLFQITGLLLVLQLASFCQEYIRIDYTGLIKKPFQTLIVSTKDIPDTQRTDFITNVTLDSIRYERFKEIIVSNLPKDNRRVNTDFGCFSVAIKQNGGSKAYYLASKEISIKYFDRILAAMKEEFINSKINEAVETYLKRIGG